LISRKKNKIQNRKGMLKDRLVIGLLLIFIAFIVFIVPSDVFFPWIIMPIVFLISIIIFLEIGEAWWQTIYHKLTVKVFFTGVLMYVYFFASMIFFSILMSKEKGQLLFLLIIAPAAIYDGTAYFAGNLIGKHKIAMLRNTSPNKTKEGTIAGITSSFILSLIILICCFPYLEIWQKLLASLLISISSFLGDLVESRFKRIMEVKDSGRILKGHGGFLDRVDSVLLNVFLVFSLRMFWFL